MVRVQVRFLLGPAGSGKTFRCLEEIRAALAASPEGPPLILLAPKQATFQLERQLLAHSALAGFTRLHIVSFERLAEFVLDALRIAAPESLNEQGRVMVLRALLMRRQDELRIFRATARLGGFAQQFSLLLREFQRYQLSPDRLEKLAAKPGAPPRLRDKLHDAALLLRDYTDWLKSHRLRDANDFLDTAAAALRSESAARDGVCAAQGLWLDGFAEMTPQELDLLSAFIPGCGLTTLAFCLDATPDGETSWLSPWSVIAQTFRRCHARLANLPDVEVSVETLPRDPNRSRFAQSAPLARLEELWTGAAAPVKGSDSSNSADAGKVGPPESIRLVVCGDREAEATLAAREILRFVRDGGRFRDCAVIVRELEPYHASIARVFRRYEIPFFMDRREPVAHHPLAELTRFAFRTVVFGWRHDDWFGALKSGLAPVAEDRIDELENEALARGWEGKTWREPLAIEGDGARGRWFEGIRVLVVPPFAKLADALAANTRGPASAPSGDQLAAGLRAFWDDLEVETTLERWTLSAGNGFHAGQLNPAMHATVWSQMHKWLENLALAFRTEAMPLREWLAVMEAGLAGLTVGVVPPALDQVLVGAIDRSRNPDLKLALVLGFNEMVFPAPPTAGMLLTEADRAALEGHDIFLGPTARQRLGHERFYGYIACTRARERLIVTRALRAADGEALYPSPLFEHIKQITGVEEEKFDGVVDWPESEHVCELAAPVLKSCGVEAGLPTSPASRLGELAALPALAPVLERWRQFQAIGREERLGGLAVQTTYGHELKTSVSALEDFAACPFKFFAARGLRLEERKTFEFDQRDEGSFQHEVLREFHRRVQATGRQWRFVNTAEARVIVENIGTDLLAVFGGGRFSKTGAGRFTGKLLIERLGDLVATLIGWMKHYEFDPARVELGFGLNPDDLPAWRLELPDGRALVLRGRVDRVDLCRTDDETALAVVMDYKSRARALHPIKLHHGLELQLLSYLGVLRHLASPEKFLGVKNLVPAGVFYVPLNPAAASGAGAARSEVLAGDEAAQRTGFQHRGRFLADAIKHFDNRGATKGEQFQYAINQSGEFRQRGNEALPGAEFEALREKVEHHLRDYATRIFEGEVTVSPFRAGNETACDRCDFRPVCRFDPWTQPYRQLRPPPRPEAAVGQKRKAST